ncbi:MAG: hypothetical protein ACWGO1_10650 [Anaerolineales bacterium]
MASSASKQPDRGAGHTSQQTAYPAATLAFYGPDDQLATKAVASVVHSEEDSHPVAVEEWHTTGTDIRSDRLVRQQIMQFLQEHNVQRVVMADRIIGCPHVEGVDYPKGKDCPYCPFWANRDRWTGQPLEER